MFARWFGARGLPKAGKGRAFYWFYWFASKKDRLWSGFVVLVLLLVSCGQDPASQLEFHRGRNALQQGAHPWARHYLQAGLARFPDYPEGWRDLGLAWGGDFGSSLTQAAACFERYLADRPADVAIAVRLARQYFHLGELDRANARAQSLPMSVETAVIQAEIALARTTGKPRLSGLVRATLNSAANWRAQWLAARLAVENGQLHQALSHLEQAIGSDPFHKEIYYLKARIFRQMDDEPQRLEQLKLFQLAAALSGSSAVPATGVDQSHANLRAFRQLLKREIFGLEWRWAMAQSRAGHYDQAYRLYEKLSGVTNIHTGQGKLLAQLAEALQRWRDVLQWTAPVLKHDPLNLAVSLRAARAETALGDLQAAKKRLLNTLSNGSHFAGPHFALAQLHLKLDELDRAEYHFYQAVDLAPWQVNYRLALADFLLTQSKKRAFRKLLSEAPVDDAALTTYRRQHLGI